MADDYSCTVVGNPGYKFVHHEL
nr:MULTISPECIES: hypothetical protein [unclassified Pedobacter]